MGLILGQEDPLEEGMATHSSILAWRVPWTEEPGGLQSVGSQGRTWLSTHRHTRAPRRRQLPLRPPSSLISCSFASLTGISHGSVVAGVIGAKKPQYDIWGKTVNLASRMDSTGVSGRIQVPEETYLILKDQGFAFDYRGEIYVKGISEQEGKIKTYFLLGRVQPNPFILPPRRLPGQYSLAAVVLGLVQSLNRQRQKQLLNENNNTGIIKGHYNRRTLLTPSGPEPGAPAEGADKSELP